MPPKAAITAESATPSRRRRAILRGSLAVPVVLTVAPPSAAASSLNRCIVTRTNPLSEPVFTSTYNPYAPDMFVRKSVTVDGYTNGSTTKWFYPKNGTAGGDLVNVENVSETLNSLQPGWSSTGTTQTRYILTWFTKSSGTVDTNYPVTRTMLQEPVTTSCYASFTPA